MPHLVKHIIFSSKEILNFGEITEAIVFLNSYGNIKNSRHKKYKFTDLNILSDALQLVGYEPKFVYEVLNPSNNYETLIACNGCIDYIFFAKDAKFKRTLSSLKRVVMDYSRISEIFLNLELSARSAMKNLSRSSKLLRFPNNRNFRNSVDELVKMKSDIVYEAVFEKLRGYMLFPIR